jgi:hypothetical protein
VCECVQIGNRNAVYRDANKETGHEQCFLSCHEVQRWDCHGVCSGFGYSLRFIRLAQTSRREQPNLTYKYHNDDELVQTNELAAAFCSRYQAVPRSMSFIRDGSGDDVVVYECVSTSRSTIYASDFNPNMTYTYRTDQELLNGSQNAQAYCLNNGSSRVVSNVVRNSNGTRTVTFQCRQS